MIATGEILFSTPEIQIPYDRGGTEPEFSKLNRARAFSSRARAELRAQIFRAEPEPSFRASKMEIFSIF